MHKKFPCMLLIIVVFLSVTMIIVDVQSSPATQLYVDPSKIEYWTPALNEIFMVNISIANVFNLTGFELKLFWNTTLLDLVDVDIQPFLNPPMYVWINITDEDLGRYWLFVQSFGEPKDGSGALATLFFKITYELVWPKNVTGTLDLADTGLLDHNNEPIDHEVYDGEYWCYGTPPLGITTMTDKPSYNLLDTVYVYGNLTLGYSPVQDGIVALQIDDPLNKRVVIRTLTTDVPPATQMVEILDVIPCGGPPDYNPKKSFYKGYPAYFNVSIKNNDVKTRQVLIAANLYDSRNVPFAILSASLSVPAGTSASTILSYPIPDTVSAGDAMVYANALSKWPKDGGVAYCPEKSDTFTILDSSSTTATTSELQSSSSGSEGTYNLTFRLGLSGWELGNYTIYANSNYTIYGRTQRVTRSLTFEVGGLVGDVNGDGIVDIFDLVIVAAAYGSKPGDPDWDIRADLNGDGTIDIFDLVIVASHYGETV